MICPGNQWAGLYMIGISVIKELKEDVCSQKKRYRAKAMHDCNDKKVEADGSIDKYLSYH